MKAGEHVGEDRRREAEVLLCGQLAEVVEAVAWPRIQAELADDHGVRVGRKRVARLMRELGCKAFPAGARASARR